MKPGGEAFITVPNMAELESRVKLLFGKSISTPVGNYRQHYEYASGSFLGFHWREHVLSDLNRWNPKNKVVVLDGRNCSWSKSCIGMPSVIKVAKRLVALYGDSISHMNRNIGLAWLYLAASTAGPHGRLTGGRAPLKCASQPCLFAAMTA